MLCFDRHYVIIVVGGNPGKDGKKMKIEISKEDYQDLRLAITAATNYFGPGYRMSYESLRERLVDAWETALEEEIIARYAKAKAE